MKSYRSWFQLFWLGGDAAFADPDLYGYCQAYRITYFIRLRGNLAPYDMIEPYLTRPVGRPPKSGVQVRVIDFHYQAQSWSRPRRVVCKIEGHSGELFPRAGFIVSNSRLTTEEIVKVYRPWRGGEPDQGGQEHASLGQDSRHRPGANHARLKMVILAYSLLHISRVFYLYGEEIRRSMEWLIRRLIKVGAKIAYHSRRWHIQVTSTFPLAHHYREVLGYG